MTVAADNPTLSRACRRLPRPRPATLASSSNATPAASAPASKRPAEAIALARKIAALPGLVFAGFMLYPTETGWADAQNFFDEALAGVRAHGLGRRDGLDRRHAEPGEVGKLKGVTEHRARYLYFQRPHADGAPASRRSGGLRAATSTRRWSAAPARNAAFSMRARRRSRLIPAAASTVTA